MMSQVFTVAGMTCGHCVGAVTKGIEELPDVRQVSVDLRNGQVTITSDHPVAFSSVRSTVELAGFQMVVPARV